MNIIIIEDEPLASDSLHDLLCEIDPDIHCLERLDSIESSVDWLTNNSAPDLVFCDIHLSDGLSFEIFHQVKVTSPIIFTTAYDEYAIKAFEVNSIDYLLKPFSREKLVTALNKFKELQKSNSGQVDLGQLAQLLQKPTSAEYKSRFLVKLGHKIKAIATEKIAYFFSEEKVTFLVTFDKEKFPLDQSLEELITVLDPTLFFRANRKYIIHFDSVKEIQPYFKGRLTIRLHPDSNEDIVISSERTPEFKKWLDK